MNNFAVNTWPNYFMDKLMFPVKWQLKLAKQGAKIILVEELWQILKLEYRLDISSLKLLAIDLVSIFTNIIEVNPNKFPV